MGLLLKLLCQQAENAGLQLVVNTNSLENEAFMKQIATAEVSASSKPASAFARKAQLLDRIAAQKVGTSLCSQSATSAQKGSHKHSGVCQTNPPS